MSDDTRDRVIALEVKVVHLSDQLETANKKLDVMFDMLTQAKGGWKLALGFTGFVGFVGGVASWLVPPFLQK